MAMIYIKKTDNDGESGMRLAAGQGQPFMAALHHSQPLPSVVLGGSFGRHQVNKFGALVVDRVFFREVSQRSLQ